MGTNIGDSGKPQDTPATASESDDGVDGDNGVDVSLIRWMLSLTSDERLDVLQTFVDGVPGDSIGRTQR